MASTPLGIPPNNVPPIDKSGFFNVLWQQWFSSLVRKVAPNVNRQDIIAAASINPDSTYVTVGTYASNAGTYAVTLEAPTIPGLMKMIEMTARDGAKNVTLALTNCDGGSAATTCTFNGTTQKLLLMAGNTKWTIFKERGVTLS